MFSRDPQVKLFIFEWGEEQAHSKGKQITTHHHDYYHVQMCEMESKEWLFIQKLWYQIHTLSLGWREKMLGIHFAGKYLVKDRERKPRGLNDEWEGLSEPT